jgi:hypothetical protein
MSLPNIPDITPKIDVKRSDAIKLLLTSIALEEIGLSHIINAEGEKIQAAIHNEPSIEELIQINKSVERTMRNVIKNQMLLQFKLEDVLAIDVHDDMNDDILDE